jgi:hypothetical protein
MELVMPLSLVKASDSEIPICSVGCDNKMCNFQGYAFSFCGTNCPYVKQVDMCLRIPSSLPSLLKKCDNYTNVYGVWIALSPYKACFKASQLFVQAVIGFIVNSSGYFIQLLVIYAKYEHPAGLYVKCFSLSKFACTEMHVMLNYCYYSGNIFACFKDSNGCKLTYCVYPCYTFLLKSALIIGEAPSHGNVIICGKQRYLLWYTLLNDSFNVGFAVEGRR